MSDRHARHGFTLVELLIIVAILVALIATMIQLFDPFERKGEAYDVEREIHTRQIYKSINDYLWDQNYSPADFPAEGEYKWICQDELTGTDCTADPVSGGVSGVDIKTILVDGGYLSEIPDDPVFSNANFTGFRLTMDGDYYTADAPYTGIYYPPPDPIAWWKLDEETAVASTIAVESVGGLDGTYYNMAAGSPTADLPPTNLVNNRSMNIDNSDDYIMIADDATFDITETLSITAWVKGNSWGTTSNADIILRKGDDCNVVWEFAITDRMATLILDGCEGGSNSYEGGTLLDTSEWYHVAGVWDGSSVNIYVNGTPDGTYSHSSSITTDDDPVYIGGRNTTAGTDRFDGLIDDVRLYDVPLTADQVRWMAEGLF